jgi:4'-phosphopantetheinyl transferase
MTAPVAGDVDVWSTRLRDRAAPPPAASAAESERAARFFDPADAAAFLLRRAFVRSVLACYLARPSVRVELVADPGGRLRASTAGRPVPFEFSVSASDGIALCAVAARPVGVDVERVRPAIDWGPVARRFFSAAERDAIRRGDPDTPFRIWTFKEAVIKARGGTLARDLDGLDVADLLAGAGACCGFSVRSVDVGQAYAAAVVVDHPRPSIAVRAWDAG